MPTPRKQEIFRICEFCKLKKKKNQNETIQKREQTNRKLHAEKEKKNDGKNYSSSNAQPNSNNKNPYALHTNIMYIIYDEYICSFGYFTSIYIIIYKVIGTVPATESVQPYKHHAQDKHCIQRIRHSLTGSWKLKSHPIKFIKPWLVFIFVFWPRKFGRLCV